jgi:hypothetical protein
VDEKAMFLELMWIVDFHLAGFGYDVQTCVGYHFRGMLADFLLRIDGQKSGVGIVDINDAALMVGDDDANFEVVDNSFKKISTTKRGPLLQYIALH